MAQKRLNDVTTALASTLASSSATSATVTTGDGTLFSTAAVANPIRAGFFDATTNALVEIIDITGRATDVLTIVRAVEDATRFAASAWTSGTKLAPIETVATAYAAQLFIDSQDVVTFETLTNPGSSPPTWNDLTTAGPTVTFTVPSGETWDVMAQWNLQINVGTGTPPSCVCGISVDGTDPANNDYSVVTSGPAGSTLTYGCFKKVTGLTAGSHTIKMRYSNQPTTNTTTSQFGRRHLMVTRVAVH